MLNKGSVVPESMLYPDMGLVDAIFDPVTDSITFALGHEDAGFLEVQQFMKNGDINLLASVPVDNGSDKLCSFAHFVDSCQLVFIFSGGDIVTATYDMTQPNPDTTVVEIVGSIDVGIGAASWSPDEETLTLLTRDSNLLLMSRMFEPISEKALNPDDIKISDSKHVSVGWGKKETQFKGKGAKALERERDALRHAGLKNVEDGPLKDPTVNEIEQGTLSSFDTLAVKIDWRGDCEYFTVTTVEQVLVEDTSEVYDRRVIRVFSRDGKLDSVNEAVDGLEHNLAWKPQGSLIASTQRHFDEEEGEEVLDVVFYERNGLRHGQFNSRLDPTTETIVDLVWSSDSEILAFQLHDRVQLWTTKNYHWYLKQEIMVKDTEIMFVKFHPEKPLHFMIGTSNGQIQIIDLGIKIVTGPAFKGYDLGVTLVTDGTTCKITPLSIANVPPPISFREEDVPGIINDLAVSKNNQVYGALTSTNEVHLITLKMDKNLPKSIKHPQLVSTIALDSMLGGTARQLAFIGDTHVAVVVDTVDLDSKVQVFNVEDVTKPEFQLTVPFSCPIVLIKSSSDFKSVGIETIRGEVHQIDDTMEARQLCQFPEFCREFEFGPLSDSETGDDYGSFGISNNGKLYCNETLVASAVTSMKITESNLLFTTALSKLCFLHLNEQLHEESVKFFEILNNLQQAHEIVDERIRTIERGSILVNCVPSNYSVVLEAPRGNLETIYPRIMCLSGIRQFISEKKYREAFLLCRAHRIDLDILYDYDPQLFELNVEAFISQIGKVEYLDLFVSCLHDEDVTLTKYRDSILHAAGAPVSAEVAAPTRDVGLRKIIRNKEPEVVSTGSKINKVCEIVVSALINSSTLKEKYLQTILTAYACEQPPNLALALDLIGDFKDLEKQEQAVIHLCFLQDANSLYQASLGLYDVKLTLAFAQQSQMDPKEYLPFLQNLHVQAPLRRKFLIDDYLKRYEKALQWLHELDQDKDDDNDDIKTEFNEYMVAHDLYKVALKIYRYDDSRSEGILKLYGDHLSSTQNHKEAALCYEYLNDYDSALDCYVKAKAWKEALSIVQRPQYTHKMVELATTLVSMLVEDHKYAEAAEIEHMFLKNVEEAVRLYCKSYMFDKAILVSQEVQKPELVESIVDVQMSEGYGVIAELLADCRGQIESQLRRLRELRQKKAEDPYAFYGMADNDGGDVPDNVSVAASEASTTASFFTRYTGKTAGTAKTGASRRTTKNRKREERKRAKGRKGTIYEEEYLINSVGRMLDRLTHTQPDAVRLVECLLRRRRKEQAYQVQRNWTELITFVEANIKEIHTMNERDRERVNEEGEVYLIPEIPIPSIPQFPKFNVLDF